MFFKNSDVKFSILCVLLHLDNLRMQLLKYKPLKKMYLYLRHVIKPKTKHKN